MARSRYFPFLELHGYSLEKDRAVSRAVKRVTRSGNYVLGKEVEKFEKSWSDFIGAKYCVSVGSGLSALELGLRTLGVSDGDHVIVPEKTFIATWMAVSNIGAIPIPARSEQRGFNIDPNSVAQVLTPKTRAIVPVHLYGHPCDLEALSLVSKKAGVPILEDAAQAHGAELHKTKIGGHGNMVAWSFYPGKNLGALGDGGALTTNSGATAAEIRLLRNYGSPEKYVHEKIGFNSRLDEIQAAVLSAKLPYLESENDRRRECAEIYVQALEKITDSSVIENIRLVRQAEDAGKIKSSWHIFSIEVAKNCTAFMNELTEQGVQIGSHYPTWPANQKAYAGTPIAGGPTQPQRVSLPLGPHLSASKARRIASIVARSAGKLDIFSAA